MQHACSGGGDSRGGRPDLLLNFTPRAGGAEGHRGGLQPVMALAREYFDVPIGGPDAPRPLLE